MNKSHNVFLILTTFEAGFTSERLVIKDVVLPRLKQKYLNAGITFYLNDLSVDINEESHEIMENTVVMPPFSEYCNFTLLETSGIYEEDQILFFSDELFEEVCAVIDKSIGDVEKDIVIKIEFETELFEDGDMDDETYKRLLDIDPDEDMPEAVIDGLYDLGMKLDEEEKFEQAANIMCKYFSLLEAKKETPSLETINQNVHAALIAADFFRKNERWESAFTYYSKALGFILYLEQEEDTDWQCTREYICEMRLGVKVFMDNWAFGMLWKARRN